MAPKTLPKDLKTLPRGPKAPPGRPRDLRGHSKNFNCPYVRLFERERAQTRPKTPPRPPLWPQDRPGTAQDDPKTGPRPAPGGYRTTPKRIKNAPSSPRLPRARAPGLGSASPSLPDLGRFLAYMGQPGKWRTIGPMTMNMDEPKMGSNPPDELHISGGIRVPSGPNWMICGVGHGWGKITNCQNRSH